MNVYHPNIRVIDVPYSKTDQNVIEVSGIPDNLQEFETVCLMFKGISFRYLASVFFIDTDDDKFYLTWNKSGI